MDSFVKTYRNLLTWEWHDKPETGWLFFSLIQMANYADGTKHGIEVKRSQVLTSLNDLSKQTGISKQSVRTSLNRLISTHEITQISTHKYSIITICNYDSYQPYCSSDQHSEQQSIQHAINTLEEEKEKNQKSKEDISRLVEEEISSLSKDNSDTKNAEPSLKPKKTRKNSKDAVITIDDVIKEAEEMLFSTFDEDDKKRLNEFLEFSKYAKEHFPDVISKVPKQMSFQEYCSLRADEHMSRDKIKSILKRMENYKDIHKKKSVYLTISVWSEDNNLKPKN